jgi:hypothetical protein
MMNLKEYHLIFNFSVLKNSMEFLEKSSISSNISSELKEVIFKKIELRKIPMNIQSHEKYNEWLNKSYEIC